jgi:hypothetical protein
MRRKNRRVLHHDPVDEVAAISFPAPQLDRPGALRSSHALVKAAQRVGGFQLSVVWGG